jgi:hypothetical protein
MRSMVCESGEFAVSISKVQSVNRLCWALCWRKMMLISRFLVITVPSSTVHAVRSLDSLSLIHRSLARQTAEAYYFPKGEKSRIEKRFDGRIVGNKESRQGKKD